jgi:hypothetical protein
MNPFSFFQFLNFVRKEDKNRNNPDDEGSFFIPVTLLVAFAIVLVFIISLLVIVFINIVLFFLESSTHPLRTLFP